jgi:hypothetical protein
VRDGKGGVAPTRAVEDHHHAAAVPRVPPQKAAGPGVDAGVNQPGRDEHAVAADRDERIASGELDRTDIAQEPGWVPRVTIGR